MILYFFKHLISFNLRLHLDPVTPSLPAARVQGEQRSLPRVLQGRGGGPRGGCSPVLQLLARQSLHVEGS